MIRRVLLFGIALAVLAGSLTTVFATTAELDNHLRGYVDATLDANLPFRVPRLGVNADLLQYTPDQLPHQLELMQQAQIVWIRQFAYWDDIEPTSGQYDWQRWDALVAQLADYPDLKLIVVLMNTPAWARSGGDPTAPPDDPALFAQFARAFAQRYGAAIDYYQIWDEPNLIDAWGGNNPRPAHYAALLEAAYSAIHSADSDSHVIAAALAPTVEQGPQNISDLQYLRDLYALGAQAFTDGIAAKPYGFSLSPADRTVSEDVLNFSRIVLLREEMVRNGDGQKQLWASEWGWNSLPEDWNGPPSIWGQVSAENQVQYVHQGLARAEREWPWLSGMILQHWQPDAPLDNPAWGFSLLDPQSNPAPLWEFLAGRTVPQAATDGLYPAQNPYARYSGVWTFGELGADIGWVNDSALSFDFAGRDVALLVREDDYVAYLYITIDNEQANALPTDADGNAYLLLTSDTLEPQVDRVTVARQLPLSEHTLRAVADDLVPDEAKDRWSLVGYAVSSGNLRAPYDRQIAVAWVAVVVAAAASVITGVQVPWGRYFSFAGRFWRGLSHAGQLAISVVTSIALMAGMLLTWGSETPALFRRDSVQLALAILTAGLIYLEPGLVLTLAASLALFIMIFRRLELGLLLTILWAPFFLFPVELLHFAFPVAEVVILITTAAWLLRLLGDWAIARQTVVPAYRLPLPRFSWLDWAILAWVVLGVISLSWSALRGNAMTDLRVMFIEPALFYAILRTRCSGRVAQLMLVDALLVAGLLVSVIGLVMFFQGESIITAESGIPRLASVYGSPNNLGLFLGRCIPFALAFILVPVDRRRLLFAVAAIIFMLAAVSLSQSAGALFIGIPVSAAAVLWLVWRRRAWLPLVGMGVLGAALFAVALRSARFARLLDFTSGTNFARLRVWESAWHIIEDHPLTGIGLDQFLYAFRGTYILPDAWQEPNLSHPHNVILDFWVRLGIGGVFIFAWLQLAFWSTAYRTYTYFRTRDPYLFALVVGTMGSMINLLSHGLVDNSVYVNDLAFVFVLLLGLIANLSNARSIDEPQKIMV